MLLYYYWVFFFLFHLRFPHRFSWRVVRFFRPCCTFSPLQGRGSCRGMGSAAPGSGCGWVRPRRAGHGSGAEPWRLPDAWAGCPRCGRMIVGYFVPPANRRCSAALPAGPRAAGSGSEGRKQAEYRARAAPLRAELCGLQRAVPELLCRDCVGAADFCRELYLGTGSPGVSILGSV